MGVTQTVELGYHVYILLFQSATCQFKFKSKN